MLQTCLCDSLRANARKSIWRLDPTRTSGLRRRFLADLRRGFKDLRRSLRKAVLEADVLGLKGGRISPERAVALLLAVQAEYESWLRSPRASGAIHGGEPWWRGYIKQAYRQGLLSAEGNLIAVGAEVPSGWADSLMAPRRVVLPRFRLRTHADTDIPHADRVQMLEQRTYSHLSGISADMSAALSSTLAEGMSAGTGAYQLSRQLAEAVDIGLVRAERIARTEIIGAHAEASLNAYDAAGVGEVGVLAEFVTAQDDQVCPKCAEFASRHGGVYSLEEARGLIPVHPNCRCAWLPVVDL